MSQNDTALIYVSVIKDNGILAFELDLKSGDMTTVGKPTELYLPWSMAFSPNKHYLYVTSSNYGIASLEINEDVGDLKLLDHVMLKKELGMVYPTYLFVDHTGKYLLVCDYFMDTIATYKIGNDGCIISKSLDVISVGGSIYGPKENRQHPHSIQIEPTGRYVVAPFTGKNRISFFDWNPKYGRISRAPISQVETIGGTGPRHFAYHPSRPFVYFAMERGELLSRVTFFEVVKGEPTLIEKGTWSTIPESFTQKNSIADIHVTPNGRFVYISNRGHDSLAGFAISEKDGSLTPLGQFKTSSVPITFAIDDSSRFALVAGMASGTLSVHRIDDKTGKLSEPKVIDCVWYGSNRGRIQTYDKPVEGGVGAPWVVTRPR